MMFSLCLLSFKIPRNWQMPAYNHSPPLLLSLRPPGGVEVYNESNGSTSSDWLAAVLRHCYVCHHWGGVLHGQIPHHLLQERHW